MMALFFEFCAFWLLATTVAEKALSQRPDLTLECVGNVLKISLNSSLSIGRQIEVEAINGSQIVTLTPALAAQCGYSIESDPWGNARIYTSLLSCFTRNHGDAVFDISLRLNATQMSGVHEVEKTCEYNRWASREVLCARNFMEVSVYRGHNVNLPEQIKQAVTGTSGFSTDQQLSSLYSSITLGDIWRMVFYTPKEKPMMLEEFQNTGYGVLLTPTRLVLRSPYNAPEVYTEDVNGVQMKVFKVSTYFRQAWSVMIIDSAAVCPTGGLHFTKDLITWYMPKYITPLTAPQHQILEMYMGVNGKRLNQTEMEARGYTMVIAELETIIYLPVGGPDGYYKSKVLNWEYYTVYNIEPMLEMLWVEGKSEITRYKVHYPITTPPQPQLPYVTDNTEADLKLFNITVGSFLPDVVLVNFTLSTGVVSVEEARGRGFDVREHLFTNGSKTFSIMVPFSDPAVMQTNVGPMNIVYSLSLTFGLLILPEYAPFSLPALVQASHKDFSMLTMDGVCNDEHFYITIEHRNQGIPFHVKIGKRTLTADLYAAYGVKENATHMTMAVPFLAQDVVFEKANHSSLRAHVDVVISYSKWQFQDFSLACTFPFIMTECFPNGSITALAVKVEAANGTVLSQLTLRDPACKPTFSNDRFAYFSFNASSCQTTRTFHNGIMTYWNEISTGNRMGFQRPLQNTSDYRVTVVCNYNVTQMLALTFSSVPYENKYHIAPGFGELPIRMRLARNASYDSFYMAEDYPVVQYLKKPLYFEVELMQSLDPRVELVLENCWASANHGGVALSWDLLVNGCTNPAERYQVTFYPVAPEDHVRYPSHVRRFKIEMFTFVKDHVPLHDQILIHCEAVLCDVQQTDGVCNAECPLSKAENAKKGRRNVGHKPHKMWVSSERILISGL